MVGHAAHGHGNSFFFVSRGQRDLQFFGGYHGVLKEQLVEISEPEEQKCRGMLFLDGSVLPHQRSGRLIHRAGFGGL